VFREWIDDVPEIMGVQEAQGGHWKKLTKKSCPLCRAEWRRREILRQGKSTVVREGWRISPATDLTRMLDIYYDYVSCF